jgi:RNA polymerase sigma-70 factor (ECF subfamily)
MLRARKARREELRGAHVPQRVAPGPNPKQERVLADSVGLALLVVLETLTPAERLAWVLHDMFAMPSRRLRPSSENQWLPRSKSRAARADAFRGRLQFQRRS